MPPHARGVASLILLLALLGLAVIGGGAYFIWHKNPSQLKLPAQTTQAISTAARSPNLSSQVATSSEWVPITIQTYTQKYGYPAYPDADSSTFEMSKIDNLYSRDKDNIYWDDQIIPGADKATFTVLGTTGNLNNECSFAKDKNHLYYEAKPISTQADLTSLRFILDAHGFFTGYAVDNSHVYYNNCDGTDQALTEVPGADPRTFTALVGFGGRVAAPIPLNATPPGPYAPMGKDASHVYVKSVAKTNIDASSFRTLYEAPAYSYFEDSHTIYLYYVGSELVALPDANQETFNPHPKSFYVQIKSAESPDSFAADGQHVYVDGKLVPGADPQTFVVLATAAGDETQYEKDKSSVYFLDKPVVGADYGTFTVDISMNSTSTPVFDAQDINHHYSNGQIAPDTLHSVWAEVAPSVLIQSPGKITLSGTSNAKSLSVTIESNAELKDALGQSSGYLAFSSGAHDSIAVNNGRWTVSAGYLTQPGTYVVKVYDFTSDVLLSATTLTIATTTNSSQSQ